MADIKRTEDVRVNKDTVKIKVIFNGKAFNFSREKTNRILLSVNIPNKDAECISKDIKGFLLENKLFDVDYADFEQYATTIMNKYNYNGKFVERFKMMYQFNLKRCPLVVLIAGTNCIGKSMIAVKLSERMHIYNVLQTQIIADLVGSINSECELRPYWANEVSSREELLHLFQRESEIVRKGSCYDIIKAFTEEKRLIIEGHHIIKKLYVKEFDGKMNMLAEVSGIENNGTNNDITLYKGGTIVSFLLTASEDDLRFLILKKELYHDKNKIVFDLSDSSSKSELNSYVSKFLIIQEYLQANSNGFIKLQIDLDNPSTLIDTMQNVIIDRIHEEYNKPEY